MFAQTVVGQIGDSLFISKSFFKQKIVTPDNISTNDIWFGIFPLNKYDKIKKFSAKFTIPKNLVIYNKIYLNGSKTTAGYNPVWAVGKNGIKNRSISFDYTKEISKNRNAFFWFHLVPILNGMGKITVKYKYEYNNGKKGSGVLKSGKIISKKPKIKKILVHEGVNNGELRFYLKYNFDFEYYIKPEDNPVYELILKDPSGEEILLNTNKFYVQNDRKIRVYTISKGKIKVQNTEWDVSGMSFIVNGKIVRESRPIVTVKSNTSIERINIFGYDNMDVFIEGKVLPLKFSKHPSLLCIGLNIIKIRFRGGFHFIPISVDFFSRFSDESFWALNIKSEYELNNYLSISFGGGLGYEASWNKANLVNNLLLYELGGRINLGIIWSALAKYRLNIDFLLAHLSDAHTANITGVYLGFSKILPTRFVK